ncbi:flagellar hook-length control protein FliK [Yoonia maricola]|uniref:Flagellar hook-length control protein FliK n=1 Tax=Yoonia maricola TaxID=420999 RepID=A0A2M8W5D1_9RHOB|nr:flagellar hook-length control protein FliK [Yoonia maricola]PJI86133.1 flagellar hook-length control protein FliK [Yoonia maricola]
MIPLILSEPAAGNAKPVPKTDRAADDSSAATFGDLMADPDAPIDAAPALEQNLTDNLLPETDPDIAETDLPLSDQPTPEDKVAVPLLADAPPPAKPVADATGALIKGDQMRPPPRAANVPADPAAQDGEKATLPRQAEKPDIRMADAKPQRPSVAQSVMEGKLPQLPAQETVQKANVTAVAPAKPEADVVPLVTTPPPGNKPVLASPNNDLKPKSVSGLTAEERADPPREDPRRESAITTLAKPTAPPLAPAPPPAVALAQAAAQPLREANEKNAKPAVGDLTITSAPLERQAPLTSSPTTVAGTASPETARQVATQIAIAVSHGPGKTTEIALNPEELGRVRLSLSAVDGAISLNILAERPETSDLIRRHMDLLSQEFRQLGYTSISFSFGDQKDEANAQGTPLDETAEPEVQEIAETPQIVSEPPTSGLDLRI